MLKAEASPCSHRHRPKVYGIMCCVWCATPRHKARLMPNNQVLGACQCVATDRHSLPTLRGRGAETYMMYHQCSNNADMATEGGVQKHGQTNYPLLSSKNTTHTQPTASKQHRKKGPTHINMTEQGCAGV